MELGGKISLKRRGGLEFLRIVSFFQFVFNVLAPVLFLNDKKNNLSFKCKKWGMSYFVEEHVFKELNIKKSVSLPYEKTKEIFLPLIFFFLGGGCVQIVSRV